MANILVHLRCQAKCADRRKMVGVSRAFAAAKALTNLKASSLQRPPVSTPTTTRWQRSPSSNSAYFLSLSRLALTNTAPSTCAAFPEGRPAAESADRRVMSTASWAPWCKGRPDATTSMARWSVVYCDIHVVQSAIASNDGSCFSAHSCHGAFCWQGSGTQPSGPRARSSVPTDLVQRGPALTTRFRDLDWQHHSLEKKSAEQHGLHWGSVGQGTRPWA